MYDDYGRADSRAAAFAPVPGPSGRRKLSGADGLLKALDANQPRTRRNHSCERRWTPSLPILQAEFNLALVLGMQGKDAEAVPVYRKTA